MESFDEVYRDMIRAEIETDLRRAILGSDRIGNPMLSYLLKMAMAELQGTDIPTDKVHKLKNEKQLFL